MNNHAEIKIIFSDTAENEPVCTFNAKINIIRDTPDTSAFSIICRNPEEITFICNGRKISPQSPNSSKSTSDFISGRITAELNSGSNEITYSHPLYIQKRSAGSFIFGKSKNIFTVFAELKQIKSVFDNRNFSLSVETFAEAKNSFIKNLILSPFIIFYGGKNHGEERGVNYRSKTKRNKRSLYSVLKFGIDFPDRISVSIGRRKLFR
jgi:hypothetical protein